MVKLAVCVEVTEKLWETDAAAAKFELPGCDAWMVQVPARMRVAVFPETVQTDEVSEAKLTASPELAVAVRLTGVPTVCAGIPLNVMVWLALPTWIVCDTGVAAL